MRLRVRALSLDITFNEAGAVKPRKPRKTVRDARRRYDLQ